MIVTPEMLLEACYPLGDAMHHREVKRAAVRLVMLERRSYRTAAREVGVGSHKLVARWVAEAEMRLGHAKEALEAVAIG